MKKLLYLHQKPYTYISSKASIPGFQLRENPTVLQREHSALQNLIVFCLSGFADLADFPQSDSHANLAVKVKCVRIFLPLGNRNACYRPSKISYRRIILDNLSHFMWQTF